MTKISSALLVGASLFAGAASAGTTLNVPADYSTIQAAIDAAADGDTVLVAPGTYYEGIDFEGKAITVKSSGGAAVTILDANGASGIVTFGNGEGNGSVLQGFTLTHVASYEGGAAVDMSSASPSILDNVFTDNQDCGYQSGAAIIGSNSSAVVLRNYFSGNGCLNPADSIGWVNDIRFDSVVNFLYGSSPTVADNVFVNNRAVAYAQVLDADSAPAVYNNTLVGNFGGIWIEDPAAGAGTFFSNNLIAFNYYGLTAVFSNGATLPAWTHNLVYGNTTADYVGVAGQTGANGNLSAAPYLKDWGNGNVRLLSASPAIDAGDGGVSQASATDFYGAARSFDGDGDSTAVADIGAAESIVPDVSQPGSTVIRVPADQPTIQAGIDAALNTYTVLVAPGTYYENLDFKGKPITVKSSDGAAATILDGTNGGVLVEFHHGEGSASVLQGFTVTHSDGISGLAVVMSYSSPTVEDNVFVDNGDNGAGTGSAILGVFSSGTVIRNYFAHNRAAPGDVGFGFDIVVSLSDGSPVVADNVFVNNAALALYDQTGSGDAPQIYNNTLVGNTTAMQVSVAAGTPGMLVSNNLVAFNQGVGVAMFLDVSATQAPFSNNLVYGNVNGDYFGIDDQTGLNGNLSADPKLKDAAGDDVHLLFGSPAIDAGDSSVSQVSSTDFDGNARVTSGSPNGSAVVDIGAIEFTDTAATADDGSLAVKTASSTSGTLSATVAYTGQTFTFALVSQPSHGVVSLKATSGQFTYTPAAGYVGADSFTFKVTDAFGQVSNTATESVTVSDVAPKATGGLVRARRNTSLKGMLRATTAYSGQVLQYQIVSGAAHGTVIITDAAKGAYTYTPAAGFRGKDSFTFRVVDQWGTSSNTAPMNIDVF